MHSCHSCVPTFVAVQQQKNEKQPSIIESTELRLLLKIMEIKEMKMKGNLVTGKHW